jgi:hypothetical protein
MNQLEQLSAALDEFGASIVATLSGETMGTDNVSIFSNTAEHARRAACDAFIVWMRLRAMHVAVATQAAQKLEAEESH